MKFVRDLSDRQLQRLRGALKNLDDPKEVRRACRELNSTADKILDIDFRTEEYSCPAA